MKAAAAALGSGLICCAVMGQVATASPERGRALLLQRQDTGCVLCHQIPGMPAGGTLGPSLHGLAQRSTLEQAREQVADADLPGRLGHGADTIEVARRLVEALAETPPIGHLVAGGHGAAASTATVAASVSVTSARAL